MAAHIVAVAQEAIRAIDLLITVCRAGSSPTQPRTSGRSVDDTARAEQSLASAERDLPQA